jgi:hypothetical protein
LAEGGTNNKYMNKKRQLVTVYSRVVGWMAPTNNFNKGMLESYKNRKEYKNGERK